MCVKSLTLFTEMNNDPVVNLIHLDKGRAKNLTCNYSHQRNKIVWFKVRNFYQNSLTWNSKTTLCMT